MVASTDLHLRPEQEAIILGYAGGKVGIAAVPGSGKTFTLAHLAARLIYDRRVGPDQEVLVVTFTNSAVNSFQARIARTLRDQYGLLPSVGYRVRTLHGLAHDIVRERPALVGLADDFTILDERVSQEIQRQIVSQRLADWWERLSEYVSPEVDPRRARYELEGYLPDLVAQVIRRAKDFRRSPDELIRALAGTDSTFDLARFAVHVYDDYQRSLAYRGAVDFDDLVWLALEALERDERYLVRLRARWPFILEDEAQDSSRLQEDMLRLLSGDCNWVRVGDPNQAINTTFTTANPRYLLDFLDHPDAVERPLSVSGRSTPSIIALANELVRWTVEEHLTPELRDAFVYRAGSRHGALRGVIQPTGPDDPQPNPLDEDGQLYLRYRPDQKITPDRELDMVVSGDEFSLAEWYAQIADLPEDERPTVAVLVPENKRGFKLVEMLRKMQEAASGTPIPYEELLRSTTATREAVSTLNTVLNFLAGPTDLQRLKHAFWALLDDTQAEVVRQDVDLRQALSKLFDTWRQVEDFLWPPAGRDSLDALRAPQDHAWLHDELLRFRQRLRRWLQAVSLPIDQLILTVAQDIFDAPVDLALAHKLAVVLRSMSETHPDWRLPQFVEELAAISRNERKFLGFDDAEAGYEPKPGVVTVATMHAAKGLEWDRVYLLAVSNYGFPSALPYDSYYGEKWYARGAQDMPVARLNLEAEALAQLDALTGLEEEYVEGQATLRARLDYARERLRLLYVGITRARHDLIITWNMGHYWHRGPAFENQPALPLIMLGEYLGEGSS